MLKDVDERIDELLRRPASPEVLNALGDLYLRKSNRVRAVEYYYRAADMLHSGQKDKRIALFKKILKVAPTEEKAYEELAAMFAKLGLRAEEKKYLLRLIQVCQTKGEYNRVNSIFRRIQQIDPFDPLAATYFQQGKRIPPGQQSQTALEYAQPPASDAVEEPQESSARGESGKERPEEEEPRPVESRTEPIAAPVSEGHEPKPRAALPSNRSVVIAGAVCLVLIIALAAAFGVRRKATDRESAPGQEQRLVAETLADGYRITVSELSRSSLAAPFVADEDLRKNRFFKVTVMITSGCLPDAFAASPIENISWVNARDAASPAVPVKGLETMTRVIRKLNACGRESAPVSVSFVAAVPLEADLRGFQARGLSQEGALLIQCGAK